MAAGVAETKYSVDGGAFADYTAPFTVSGDGEHTVSFFSKDNANNTEATQSVSFKIDSTAPTAEAALDAATPDGQNGWYKTPVSVNLSGADADGGSGFSEVRYSVDGGPISVYGSPFIVSGDGEHTVTFAAVDNAGNISPTDTATFKIDGTAPEVEIASPAEGALYGIGQSVTVSFTANDATSTVDTVDSSAPNGSALDTSTPGVFTFTVTATDGAGNQTTKSVSYKVGFNVVLLYDSNKAKNPPATYPIKVMLVDAAGNNISSATNVPQAFGVEKISGSAPGPLDDSGGANPDYNFRYVDGSYIFNLSLRGYSTGTYDLLFKVNGSPIVYRARFQCK